MKFHLLITTFLLYTHCIYAQDEITKANDCYNKKDYPCALDNYLAVLSKATYKQDQKHLVEHHIGFSYFSLKQYDKAIQYYRSASYSKPDYIYSWFGLGDCYYNLYKYDSAVANYKRGREYATDPEDKEEFSWWMGNAYLKARKQADAIEELKKVTSRKDNFYKADVLIGDGFYGLYKYDSAIFYYKKGEQVLPPGDVLVKSVNFMKGKCYRLLYKYDDAIEALNVSMKADPKYMSPIWEMGIVYVNKSEYPKAIEWYKKTYPLVTDSADIYTLAGNLAACNEKINNYPEAISWYKKRLPYSKYKYSDYAFVAKMQYARLKQPKEAEKTAEEVVRLYSLEPQSVKTSSQSSYSLLQTILGKVALEGKDTAKAQEYFAEAIKTKEKNYEANLAMADIAWARKKEDDYKKYYAAFYKSDYDTLLSAPSDIARAYARGAYVEIVNNKKSAGSYSYDVNRALSFDSLQKEAVILWPMVLTTGYNSYDLTKNKSACLALLDKAIKKYGADKEYTSYLYNSKAVMTDKTDTASIRKALEQAVKIYPENISPWDNLLKYYASYDNATGAVMSEKLIAILRKKKDNATLSVALVYKGDFYWRLGKKEDAKKAYQEALVWDSTNKTAIERAKL